MTQPAVRIIRGEHANIWRILATLQQVREESERKQQPPDEHLLEAIFEYIEGFAQKIHHPKEDDHLFPALQRRSPDAAEAIEALEAEHEQGPSIAAEAHAATKAYVRDFPQGRERFDAALDRFIQFERNHINTEEREIIPRALRSLSEEDWQAINTAFTSHEDPLAEAATRQEFRELHRRIVNLTPEPLGLGLETAEVVEFPLPRVRVGEGQALGVSGLASHYGRIQALRGIDMEVSEGELVTLVGANGAGKTTLLRCISGLQPVTEGSVHLYGRDITTAATEQRISEGVAQVPEGRQIFGPMSVEDNLRLGAYRRKDGEIQDDMDRMYGMFPILKEKRRQSAGTLSGGQQQMLAIARALMSRPRVLLLDEPSMGLAPLLVSEIFSTIRQLREQGMTVLLVEQNASAALQIADRGYVIETGQIVHSGTGSELLADDRVKEAYLGM